MQRWMFRSVSKAKHNSTSSQNELSTEEQVTHNSMWHVWCLLQYLKTTQLSGKEYKVIFFERKPPEVEFEPATSGTMVIEVVLGMTCT
jgi:hypothetical protein